MKTLQSNVILSVGLTVLRAVGCRREAGKVTNSKMISSPTVMIVDEVCSVTQGYKTDGQRVTVRGNLNAIHEGIHFLFNSRWDPFYPESGKDIQRITIRFRQGEKPDDHLGLYVDVTGTTTAKQQEGGKIAVTLDDAVIERSEERRRERVLMPV